MKPNVVKCEAKRSVETKITQIKKTFATKKRKNRNRKNTQKIFHEQRRGRHIETPSQSQENSSVNPNNIWQNAYINAIRWQCEQQVRFWKNMAEKYKEENLELKRKLEERSHPETTCVDESDQESKDAVDEQFISFLEITAKHRMERYSQRVQEAHDSD